MVSKPKYTIMGTSRKRVPVRTRTTHMNLFTDADRKRIVEAVAQAESRTSGEIVPVIVQRSGAYRVVPYRAGVMGAVVGALLHEVVTLGYDGWGVPMLLSDGALFFWMLAFGLMAGFLVPRIPVLFRTVAGGELMDLAVHARASQAFLTEEVFATRDRTGILLFLSLDEHRVEVLGDNAINAAVEPDDWGDVISDIVQGVRSGDAVGGLERAISRCGDLLERKGVEIKDDDTDELSNDLRIQ